MHDITDIERLHDLIACRSVEDWRDRVFRMGQELGYEQTLLAIFPDKNVPLEPEFAFLHSNYSAAWRDRYDAEKFNRIDPVVSHCLSKSTPLIWSPGLFASQRQQQMYEEAVSHGIKSGVSLPIHGANGETGILCFVSDTKPDRHFHEQALRSLPELSFCRDLILESSLKFMKPLHDEQNAVSITARELECLKWSAAGKSSWEIGNILRCTEANVNYHFGNIRRKFNTNSRQQAIARAIKLGLVNPA